ncbi:hypothetical protein SDC9_203334 [bioreactor metagenome]|uniref:Uncharacterized protein n=1 Tax=bioreactor metagenome TaxID=1076179 RepID=A0A645IXN5_9ZZZZ
MKQGSAVECDELLPIQREGHRQHAALRPAGDFSARGVIIGDSVNGPGREQGCVEPGGFFGLGIKPQIGDDLLHGFLLHVAGN